MIFDNPYRRNVKRVIFIVFFFLSVFLISNLIPYQKYIFRIISFSNFAIYSQITLNELMSLICYVEYAINLNA